MTRNTSPARLLTAALLTIAFLLGVGTGALRAEDNDSAPIDLKNGKWPALTQYIGTYNYDAVFGDKSVKTELDTMLKGHDTDLQNEFGVRAPIGFENDCLILKGAQKSTANEHSSYAEICVGSGMINLAIKDKKTITIYTRSDNYQYMSDGMRAWIYFQNNDMAVALTNKPENVQLVVTAQ